METKRSTFKLLFYIKKTATRKDGLAPILARITVNGERVQFSCKLDVKPKDWNATSGRTNGRSAENMRVNNLIDRIAGLIDQHYRKLIETDSLVTAAKVRNAFLQLDNQKTLFSIFDEHIDSLRLLYGQNKTSIDTLRKFERTRERLYDFVKTSYNLDDLGIREVDYDFLKKFETYIFAVWKCNENTTAKFLQRLRNIVLIAKNSGWIALDPFVNYQYPKLKTERGYLSKKELLNIIQKEMPNERLEKVKDLFLFACFTGLSFIDVKNLTGDNLREGFDGKMWIIANRQKSGITSNIPLLEIPQKLLDKYSTGNQNDRLLPMMSNQKLNSYLKEISTICNIRKELTYHVARHTFATTVTLEEGVSIEAVSKILGHRKIETTQIYAKITDRKISLDMEKIKYKMNTYTDVYNM